jgi:hypothetical protein
MERRDLLLFRRHGNRLAAQTVHTSATHTKASERARTSSGSASFENLGFRALSTGGAKVFVNAAHLFFCAEPCASSLDKSPLQVPLNSLLLSAKRTPSALPFVKTALWTTMSCWATIIQAVGKREHEFVAAVSNRWSSRYLLKDSEYSRDTSYKSVLATASTPAICIVCRPHSRAPADLVQDVGARHLQLF